MSNDQGASKWQEMAKEEEELSTVAEESVGVIDEDTNGEEVTTGESSQTQEGNSGASEGVSIENVDYETLQKKLTESEQLAHENWEKAVRATAEVDNIRRRSERDVASAHKYGSEKLITSLLPVIDSLEQALQAAEQSDDEAGSSMKEGVELTLKMFADALEKANVEQLNPMGQAFDPNRHEAMSMQDAPDAESNSVLMVFQKGYVLNGRVIRPARVVVAK
jgi:molecular chaperone GrpE